MNHHHCQAVLVGNRLQCREVVVVSSINAIASRASNLLERVDEDELQVWMGYDEVFDLLRQAILYRRRRIGEIEAVVGLVGKLPESFLHTGVGVL